MSSTFRIDPDAVLDYLFDWSAWLEDSETIATHTAVADGVTVDTTSSTGTSVTVWVSAAVKPRATLTCRVTTSLGRTDDRSITLLVQDR